MAEQKVVLVTGSSGCIGRLTAQKLARRGDVVFASMRRTGGENAVAARELVAWAARERLALHILELDVTDEAAVETAVGSLLEATRGRLDVVVNNAGLHGIGHTEAFRPAQITALLDVNVLGPQRVNRAALPSMRARRTGLLVHISSTLARMTLPCLGVYSATKAALEALAASYRYELAAVGVDSIIVEPGAFPTDVMRKALHADDVARGVDYGASTGLPQRLDGVISSLVSGPSSPDPQAVADAIVALIDAPTGTRPLRTVVDPLMGRGPEAINATCDTIERGALAALGIGDLIGASATATPSNGIKRAV